MNQTSTRTGTILKQPSGYAAFCPALLQPIPKLNLDQELMELLAEAAWRLGRLDGIGRLLSNPDLFLSIFVRQEALLSSQIEGTQCTLDEVLNFPIEPQKANEDVREVINYVEAMNFGLNRLRDEHGLPLSMRLLCEIHKVLLQGARGQHKTPGEIRTTQNWVGGSSLATASYIPPPLSEMKIALTDLEKFLHVNSGIPPLIQIAIAHAQFETIHPFLDGNGRLGRLLITLFLCEKGLLKQPLLYLSHYLKGNQFEYYKRLTAIREDGDWEGWVKFFLEGVVRVGDQAINNAESLVELTERHRKLLIASKLSPLALNLFDYLCEQPAVTIKMITTKIECADMTARALVSDFERLGLLQESTGSKRNKRYEYAPYLAFWKEIQDDFASIDSAVIERDRFVKAIEALKKHTANLQIQASIKWDGWKIKVDNAEICIVDDWTYDQLMLPMREFNTVSEEQKKALTAQLLDNAADLLEKILEYGPEKEFDELKVYELQTMGKVSKVNVLRDNEELKFRFLSGDFPSLMKDASAYPIPWKFVLVREDGKIHNKIASVTSYGFDATGAWMTIMPAITKAPQEPTSIESIIHALIVTFVNQNLAAGSALDWAKFRASSLYENCVQNYTKEAVETQIARVRKETDKLDVKIGDLGLPIEFFKNDTTH
jgi:Fic family protein